jgi:hypothetical protein
MRLRTLYPLLALLLTTGCASTAQLEARQLAYRGGNGWLGNPCLFGGVTPAAQAHCSTVELGSEGRMIVTNARVLAALPEHADCNTHVAHLKAALAGDPGIRVESIYSCPNGGGAQGLCHVSALVKDAQGVQYVLDNGAALGARNGSVATLAAFAQAVDGEYWVGTPPTAAQAIGIDSLMREMFESSTVPDLFGP